VAGLLELERVDKSYGALKVADGITLSVAEGEALAVIGPNGAGKSTLFNLITGDVAPDAGRIRFAGQDVSVLPAHRRSRLGIGRSYQIPHPFGGMTVFENLLVAATHGAQRNESDCYDDCVAVLELTGLIDRANVPAGTLTLLQRKRLEMARALALRPKLLLLDEIAGGLTEHEVLALAATIQEINRRGVTLVWIEHIVHALLSVAARLIVMDFGRLIAGGAPRSVMADPRVQEVYMGIPAA
jgi:branched-chain amino acid transport system ATP-binding protein